MTTDEKISSATKEQSQKKEAFARFMDQPSTRMMVSMIPPGEKQEVMGTLLQETFNAGWGGGAGNTAGSFLDAILKGMDKKKSGEQP